VSTVAASAPSASTPARRTLPRVLLAALVVALVMAAFVAGRVSHRSESPPGGSQPAVTTILGSERARSAIEAHDRCGSLIVAHGC
jgi:hypothetical protein